jgi:hypothetical protein
MERPAHLDVPRVSDRVEVAGDGSRDPEPSGRSRRLRRDYLLVSLDDDLPDEDA